MDILSLFLTILHLRSHFVLILFSLITLIYALPRAIAVPLVSIHMAISRLLLKNLEDSLSKQKSLSYLPPRPLVLVIGSSDVDITDTSESFGLPATADLMFALISSEDLEGLGQIMVKQLKNRYNDLNVNKRFVLGLTGRRCDCMIVIKLMVASSR